MNTSLWPDACANVEQLANGGYNWIGIELALFTYTFPSGEEFTFAIQEQRNSSSSIRRAQKNEYFPC